MLKHLEEHILQSDMTRNDVMLYYTTVSFGRKSTCVHLVNYAHLCTPHYLSTPHFLCMHTLTSSVHIVTCVHLKDFSRSQAVTYTVKVGISRKQ